MIIKIGGQVLQTLYQWDVNQDIEVSDVDTTGNPVFHFVNCHTGTALVVEPTLADNKFTVHIPNELLTRAETIKGYMYYETSEDGRRTKNPFEISVEARPMPDDYIFEDDDRYVTFAEIIAESEKLFEKLASSTFRKQDGYIQYVVEGREPVDIVPLSEIKGERGEQGAKGDDGNDYVLTDADKAEIAAEAAELVNVPTKLSQLEDDALHRTVTDAEKALWNQGGSGGVSDHRELTNRDAANQHPISAIQGLQTALDGKQASGSYATSAQLTAEASRASEAETALGTRIDGIVVPTKVSDLTNDADYATKTEAQGYVTTETERAQGAESTLGGRIDTVEAKIPSQATSTNKLADKDFVNSSISTNTAYFRGTFNAVGDLGLTYDATHEQVVTKLNTTALIPTKTNNDYVFVYFYNTTTQLVDRYDRYKYSTSDSSFAYEYTLNNSSFTAEQWAAISSGITSGKVSSYDTHIADNVKHITSSERTTWNAKGTYSKPSSGIPASDLASAVQTSLGKADSAYQKPSGGIPTSDLASTTTVNEVAIDTTPTSGSSNLITSGGVYAYIASLDGNGVAY